MTDGFVESLGCTLAWGVDGRRGSPPVLMLPPLGRHRASWSAQVPALADAYQVVLPDTRGTGLSSKSAPPYSLEVFADDALAILDALDLQTVHVMGWSMGSAVAQELAIKAPERVRSLVLLTSWARTDEPMAAAFRDMLSALEADPTEVEVERLTLELILSREALAGIPDLQAAAAQAVEDPGFPEPAALAGHISACIAHDTHSRLGSIAAPTLVVGAAEDRLVPFHHSERVAELIPGAQLVRVDGPLASHAAPLEMADSVNSAVRTFLDQQ